MRKQILILISGIALTTSAAIAQVGAVAAATARANHNQKYTCPMHPEVVTDHPGRCPKCGMTLVPVKTETNPAQRGSTPSAKKVGAIDPNRPHHEHAMNGQHDSEHEHEMKMQMSSSINLAEPMSRESSGTSWVPDSTPMY